MLEKIGLPAKPSMRGGSWVIDASHCQGCSSQFTFINRKHHCRRCGGLFCNSCTQQRMVLRGQGDSPVRICDPCKKIEEAARFELRYGHRSRAAKGNLKHALKNEEEILGQILGTGGKQHLSSGQESHADAISDHQKFGSSASCSSLNESAAPLREVGIIRSTSVEMHNAAHTDVVSSSPEELRRQAVEEKKKYKILKAEGKSDEALQAFKRGKELERQAGALEIAIRKSHRMASKAPNLSSTAGTQNTDESEELGSKRKLPPQRSKKEKDDLATELRDLGWSDADLHDADKKSVKLSLEGELSNLLGEITPKSSQGRKTGGIDKSQITAHKKKALSLKRGGKLAEAKEELKKAKILEKQLEEQELLGEDEDSDDELSALIRSLDDEKQNDLLLEHAPDPDRNSNRFVDVDLAIDGNFEVTDGDMNDPELAAVLKSFGWSDDEDDQAANHVMQSVAVDREALQSQVLALKREALSQKQAGNTADAMELLKKAKLLERDLESMQSDAEIFTPELKQETSTAQVSKDPSVAGTSVEESITGINNSFVKSPPKSKLAIQKELLALKKKALTLRREGRLNEAEEELKKGKVLEQQLEEMENVPKRPVTKVGKKTLESTHTHEGASVTAGFGEEGLDAEVTDQDLQDPALLSVLKNLGWNDDDVESVSMTNKPTEQRNDESAHVSVPSVIPRKAMRSKAETQRELLALKRKALALRRQGKTEEAEEMLEKSKALENEMADMENLHNANSMQVESHELRSLEAQKRSYNQKSTGDAQNTDADSLSVVMNNMPKDKVVLTQDAYDVNLKKMNEARKPLPPGSGGKVPETLWHESQKFGKPGLLASESSVDQPSALLDFLSGNKEQISRPASGEAAWEETPEANGSSPVSVPNQPQIQISAKETVAETEMPLHEGSTLHMVQKKELNVANTNNSLAPEERSDNGIDVRKDEILAHKRRALALKREGKLAEAREELRQAKILEKNLEEGQQSNVASASVLASASNTTSVMQESKSNQSKKPISGRDRLKIQQESLSHKRNALKLRREGKIEESEAELELAKALENQLEELDPQHSSTSTSAGKLEAVNDAVVEDLLDPQLMSALKAIGWQDTDFGVQPSRKSEAEPKVEKDGNPQAEKAYLEEQIKAEKLRALNLKRAGKQAEALEALRSAKHLEKRLALLA